MRATDRGTVSVSGRPSVVASRPKRQGEQNAKRQAAAGGSFIGARGGGPVRSHGCRGPGSAAVGDLRAAGLDRGRRSRLPRDHLPERARERAGPPVPQGVRCRQRRRPRSAVRRGRGHRDAVSALRRRGRLYRSRRGRPGRGAACGRQRDRGAQLRRRSGPGRSLADACPLRAGTRGGGRRPTHLPAPGRLARRATTRTCTR